MPINILDIFIRKYGLSNEEFITMIISVLGRKANDHKYNVTFADRILSMDTVTEFSHMQSGEYQLFPLLSDLFRAIIVIKLSRINDLKLHDVLKPETVLTGNEIDTLVDLACYCYMAFCDRRYALDKRRKVKEEMQKPFRNR